MFLKSNVIKNKFDKVKIISRHSNPCSALKGAYIEIMLRKVVTCNDNVILVVQQIYINNLKEFRL